MSKYLNYRHRFSKTVLSVAGLALVLTMLLSLWPSGAWSDQSPVAIYVRNRPFHGAFIREGSDFFLAPATLLGMVGYGCQVSNNQLLIQSGEAINLPVADQMPAVFSYREHTATPAFRIHDGAYLVSLKDLAKLLYLNYHFNAETGILDILFGPPTAKGPSTITGSEWSASQPPQPSSSMGGGGGMGGY